MAERPGRTLAVTAKQAEAVMSTPDDYRAMAEECFRRAREAESDRERQGYLELARTWLEAASTDGLRRTIPRPAVLPFAVDRLEQRRSVLFAPKILKPLRRQLSVANSVLNVLVPKVGLERPRVVPPVGQRVTAGVP